MTMRDEPRHTPDQWAERYRQLDCLIVAGSHDECRTNLNAISPRKIPREWAYRFGELAFRVHFHLYGLKVLHRFIHPENSLNAPASDKEKMVYASALFSLGSVEESIRILEQIDDAKEPEALFYRALASFYVWDYQGSIPYLKRYIEAEGLTAHRRLLGKINLAAAIVYDRDWSAAETLLDEIQSESAKQGYQAFLGYCHELKAQIRFFQGNYDEALGLLDEAMRCIERQGGLYALFIEKWIVITSYMRTRAPSDLARLRSLRQRALKAKHWDTVRECDLFESIANRDEALFRNVVIGSPSDIYRQRARRLYGESARAIGQHRLFLGTQEPPPPGPIPEFDPYREKLFKKPQLLKAFEALTVDFYKPCTLGFLFQRIFEEEVFNPFSSPPRVLQLLKRLDRWFIDNRHVLRVSFKKSEFSLISSAPIYVLVQRGKKRSAEEGKLNEMKTHFTHRTFSTAQAAQAMNISKFSAQQILNAAIQDGVVKKEGLGRGTKYRFVARRRQAEAA